MNKDLQDALEAISGSVREDVIALESLAAQYLDFEQDLSTARTQLEEVASRLDDLLVVITKPVEYQSE